MDMQPPANDLLGWIVVWVGAIVTAGVIVAATYWTIRPGETDPNHPKRMIFRNDR
ncbi:MAG: hypothetical protein WBD74_07935 [Candidatus Aquilonibacter sp.]